jgi:hypothetical protein
MPPDGRLDSVSIGALQEPKPGGLAAHAAISTPNRANRKPAYETTPYRQSLITLACYLCNTHSKTDKAAPSEAVPLLRV